MENPFVAQANFALKKKVLEFILLKEKKNRPDFDCILNAYCLCYYYVDFGVSLLKRGGVM